MVFGRILGVYATKWLKIVKIIAHFKTNADQIIASPKIKIALGIQNF